jgi:nucleotide-binding universal stress UspA family protein
VFGIARLIVGTSGSPGSLHALRYAEVLARAHDAVLIPVIAWEVPGEARGRIQPASELGRACRDLACQRLREALIAVWGEVPGGPLVQPHVERGAGGVGAGEPGCRPDDVLVVGAGRQGMLARLPFSKVSRYCLAHAQCPVMAVPPPALARELSRSRLAWVFRRRSLTPEQVLRDQKRPAA